MPSPIVSVVIPTYNGREILLRCLATLTQQSYGSVEIIVADNGSTDGTAAAVAAQYPQVKIASNATNLGFVGGCNRGAQAATGEFLLFLNNDTTQEAGFITPLVQAMQDDVQAGIVFSKVLLERDRGCLDAVGSFLTGLGFLMHMGLYEQDRGQYDALAHLFSPKGVSFMIRRKLFEQLGRFDETYFAYFDESDLSWRVWLSGQTVRFVPTSRVYHAETLTGGRFSSAWINFHAYKNRIRSLIANLGLLRLASILPVHLFLCVGVVLLHLLKGRGATAVAILRAFGWNLRFLPSTLQWRRMVQGKIRRRSDREIFRLVARRFRWADILRLYRLYTGFWESTR